MPLKQLLLFNIILFSVILMNGCTSTSIDPDSPEFMAKIKEDRTLLQENDQIPEKIQLSIHDALQIAVHENLDAHVAAIEHLASQQDIRVENIRALPSMKYSVTRHGRNNHPASSSLSVLTGQQSLEPSVSQEKFRSTRDISVNWNLIDAASALMQGKNASSRAQIAESRYTKVLQNIHRDVYAAYWNALVDDKTEANTQQLIGEAHKHIENLDKAVTEKLISKTENAQRKAPFLQSIAALQALQNETNLSKIELKSLLNMPQATIITLTSEPEDFLEIATKQLGKDIETLELAALKNRPELREAFINKNISIRSTKQEIIRTIPGTELFYALNQDTNKFLVDTDWKTYSISLVQNITDLLTFPDRYLAARNNEDLSEARRITMAAAIIAQVHIARHGLVNAKDSLGIIRQAKDGAKQQEFSAKKRQQNGYSSKGDTLLTRLQTQEKTIEYYQSLANFQESFATFASTIGLKVGTTIQAVALETEAS
jgi:multidrug efflux system outer membrane protein